MFLSVFDLFKIGVGPSSSHTMGPMTAANRFLDVILADDWPRPSQARRSTAIKVSLHGSLAYTGIGHGTGRAVVLGLDGRTARRQSIRIAWTRSSPRVESSGQITPARPSRLSHSSRRPISCFDKKTPLAGPCQRHEFFALRHGTAGCFSSASTIRSAAASWLPKKNCERMRANKATADCRRRRCRIPFSTAKQMLEMAERSAACHRRDEARQRGDAT